MSAKNLEPHFNIFRLQFWFGQIDGRPVSLFRILFAGWLLKDALLKFFLVDIFYSNHGVLPYETMSIISNPQRFTLLDLFNETWMVYALLCVWVVILLLLITGYRTRLMAILNFIFVLSFLERNLFVGSSADTVFRVMSFWLMFVPAGNHYSIDALLQQKAGTATLPRTIFAFPVRMLQLQFALVYIFSFLIKVQYPAWATGNALFYSLQMSLYVNPIGEWFVQTVPYGILIYLTYFTLLMEGAFLLFVYSPFWQPTMRQLGLLLGVMLHVGIAIFMSIPNFSAIMIICYSLFFLPDWMDTFEKYLSLIVSRFPVLRRAAELLLPSYHEQNATASETQLGSSERVLQPSQKGRSVQIVFSSVLGALFLLVLWWNMGILNLRDESGERLINYPSGLADFVVKITGLRQRWTMFLVHPEGSYGWVSVSGEFADGSTHDVLTGDVEAETWYRTSDQMGAWRKYSTNLWNYKSPEMMNAFADFHCRRFADQEIVSLKLVYNYRAFHYPDEAPNPVNQRTMLVHNCTAAT